MSSPRAHRSSASIGNPSMWSRGILAQYNHARNLHHAIQKFGSVTIKPDSAGLISHDFIIDEEELEGYNAEHWYDVRLGQGFNQRYQVIGKLGHGSRSTVWLCRDLRTERKYVTLKVCIDKACCKREVAIHDHLNRLTSNHGGSLSVRAMLESFEVEGKHGQHVCLVYEPLGVDLQHARDWLRDHGKVLSPTIWRDMFRRILIAMHFLHNGAHVPKNILMGVVDHSIFDKYEEVHCKNSWPRKEFEDRTVYASIPLKITSGMPKLCDLGEARKLKDCRKEDLLMPIMYHAPEVIPEMSWSYPVDVWAFGLMLWDLLHPHGLFCFFDSKCRYYNSIHLAQLIAIMGPPPMDFVQRSQLSSYYGIYSIVPTRPQSRYSCTGGTKGTRGAQSQEKGPLSSGERGSALEDEEKVKFLNLMRKIVQWLPEDQCSIEEIWDEEWFSIDLEVVKPGT